MKKVVARGAFDICLLECETEEEIWRRKVEENEVREEDVSCAYYRRDVVNGMDVI